MNESAAPIVRPPSFLMTALCLLAAGWVGAAFVSFFSLAQQDSARFGSGTGFGAWIGYSTLLSAVIGGVVLRALLPRLTGVEIAYGWAVAALGTGSLVGNLFAAAFQTYTARHDTAGAPVLFSDPIITLGFTAISLAVSYWVILLTGHGPRTRPPLFAPRSSSPTGTTTPTTSTDWWDQTDSAQTHHTNTISTELARTQDAVTKTCISISRSPARDMPGYIEEAMVELAICANILRASRAPDANVSAAVSKLVDGLDRFQIALTDIADDAAAYGSDALISTGLMFPSLSDTGDGGSRARYDLDHADGLATIRDAFEQLRALGALPQEP